MSAGGISGREKQASMMEFLHVSRRISLEKRILVISAPSLSDHSTALRRGAGVRFLLNRSDSRWKAARGVVRVSKLEHPPGLCTGLLPVLSLVPGKRAHLRYGPPVPCGRLYRANAGLEADDQTEWSVAAKWRRSPGKLTLPTAERMPVRQKRRLAAHFGPNRRSL